jgi:hypothetical protein
MTRFRVNRSSATVFALALLAALALACGAGSSGTTSSGGGTSAARAVQIATVAVGQPLTVTRDLLGTKTVINVTVSNVKTNVKSGNQFSQPQQGQFITAKVAVVVKEGKYDTNPYNFKIVGAGGTVFDPTIGVASPELGISELSAGQNTSGFITFDAAAGVEKGGKIALKDWAAEADAGYWTTG